MASETRSIFFLDRAEIYMKNENRTAERLHGCTTAALDPHNFSNLAPIQFGGYQS